MLLLLLIFATPKLVAKLGKLKQRKLRRFLFDVSLESLIAVFFFFSFYDKFLKSWPTVRKVESFLQTSLSFIFRTCFIFYFTLSYV